MSGKAKPVRSRKPQPGLVREPPPEERPRQRLLRSGGEALSDAEVLSVVLGNGGREILALTRAREILDEAGGLDRLAGIRPSTFQRWRLGKARAAAVLAALEISRRVVQAEVPARAPMSRPGAVARYLVLRYTQRDQEVMGAIYLDTRHRLIAVLELFRGTVSRAAVEPREVLKEGLVRGASGVVLFHTHPSVRSLPEPGGLELHPADEGGRRRRGHPVDRPPHPGGRPGLGIPSRTGVLVAAAPASSG